MRAPLSILRCPDSGQSLRIDGPSHLVSEDGTRTYPVVDGVPVLIGSGSSLFTLQEVAASGRAGARSRAPLSRFFPSGSLNVGAYERLVQVGSLARQLAVPAPARILVVGGGALGEGMEALDGVEGVTLIETDIYLSGRVSVACDGHHLPFADGVFDAVVVQAVLEHVISPQRVVEEIHRVLRPSGIVYAETPFMQQVHEGAFDFTRFTELGHRRLFRMFEEIDRGAALGPATALVWSLRYFMRALPPRSYRTALALDRLALLATFWLKYLDRRLVKHPGGRDAASGVYFLGRRAEQALADRDLVEAYRGLIPSIVEKRGIG